MDNEITVIGALPYDSVKEDCHGIKDPEQRDVIIVRHAERLADALPEKTLLIPIPSHNGPCEETYFLADAVKKLAMQSGKRVHLYCPVFCRKRESFCEMKRKGEDISLADTGFYLKDPKTNIDYINSWNALGYTTVMMDNVVDTGKTARAIAELTGAGTVAAIGDTGEWRTTVYETEGEPIRRNLLQAIGSILRKVRNKQTHLLTEDCQEFCIDTVGGVPVITLPDSAKSYRLDRQDTETLSEITNLLVQQI